MDIYYDNRAMNETRVTADMGDGVTSFKVTVNVDPTDLFDNALSNHIGKGFKYTIAMALFSLIRRILEA